MRDAVNEALQHLRDIKTLLRADVQSEVDDGGQPNEATTSDYFSTGPTPYGITDTGQFTRIDIGLMAHTVNIRLTDDIIVAFRQPEENQQYHIKVRKEESPFTIGGESGIGTQYVWLKKAESAQTDPGVELIAYK